MLRSILQWTLLCTLAGAASGQSTAGYSAVMVQNTHGSITRHRIFSIDNKLRVEPAPADLNAPVMLLDFERHVSVLLMAGQKAFIEVDGVDGNGKGDIAFLRPPDLSRPCSAFASGGSGAGTNCRNAGAVQLGNRKAVRWTGTLPDGNEASLWIDKTLNVVVKFESPGNVVELRDIQEGRQDPKLFEVPPDYSRLRLGPNQGQTGK